MVFMKHVKKILKRPYLSSIVLAFPFSIGIMIKIIASFSRDTNVNMFQKIFKSLMIWQDIPYEFRKALLLAYSMLVVLFIISWFLIANIFVTLFLELRRRKVIKGQGEREMP